MHNERFERLYPAIQAAGLDGIALNPGSSLTYLTGLNFHLMERPTVLLVVPGKTPVLVMPELEIAKARSAPVTLQSFTFGDNPARWVEAFKQAADTLDLAGKKVGVEPTRMRFLELQFLQDALPGARFVSAETVFNNLRMHKDGQEIAAMRQAVRIAQEALLATLPMIKPGITEHQVASELTIQLLRAGTDPELPFPPIVSGGPHSADPHASPSDRPLQKGDLLVIDWGATYKGYISDLTRTFAIGEVEPEFRHIAELVRMANQNGRDASRPGIPAGQVDAAAREVIEDGGYGKFFFHRVGHGIGMEAHEPPYMFGDNALILAPGMAFTVEPGIYLPGRGGVRIEDNLVITKNGAETLSDLPRELITLQ
ncbi:MAG: aminopeptidase P family protein [Anaerolineaceae bacterium]|nr:aminopeptidase P family protein [Anaerolineaceae bacterium]